MVLRTIHNPSPKRSFCGHLGTRHVSNAQTNIQAKHSHIKIALKWKVGKAQLTQSTFAGEHTMRLRVLGM